MNSIMEDYYPLFEAYQALRTQMMDLLTDEDLNFRPGPGGANPTLGALCRQIGEVEHAYIQSFKTLTMDFSYRHDDPQVERSVTTLKRWYGELDAELKKTIAALSPEDVKNKTVKRGPDFELPLQTQLDVYKEALLIFYGKVSVYLKAMEKDLSQQWQQWID